VGQSLSHQKEKKGEKNSKKRSTKEMEGGGSLSIVDPGGGSDDPKHQVNLTGTR